MLNTIKPFLKYVGGKSKLISEIIKFIPSNFNTYLEPFVGGGALFFHLQPKQSILNDSNSRLIRTYWAIQNNPEAVIEILSSMEHSKETFENLRKNKDIDLCADEFVAVWMLYLNKTCYNGLYRVNQKNEFNVPFGSYKNPTICDSERLRKASESLQGANLYNKDFREILLLAQPGDFVYCDPPYVPLSTTSNFTSYSDKKFTIKDQEDLRDLFFQLKSQGVNILLSNSSAPIVYEMYQGTNIVEIDCHRAINCDGNKRGKIKELLIY
jgi:DNA adenine methylase